MAATTAEVVITVTPEGGLTAPSNLILTDLGLTTIEVTWSVGGNSTYTMMRGSRTSYPTLITEGELLYYDTGASYNITGQSLDLQTTYVTLWAFQADNTTYSSYVVGNIGGEGMEEIADALTEGLGGLTSLTASIGTIGVILGILGYLLPSVVLSVLAFWKENPVLFMITFGVSWITGLYAPNIISGSSDTTVMGLTLGLMLIGYGMFCMLMSFRLMFWEGNKE